ncbi:uncharacterized protein LOC143302760 isoform X3 [Bombus vancouverensis nearcticus]|uniref:uncharacterized protein LOC143302760 isoform X3 n=1 Tax=Bombus vancouverensis nearcticus TaxID=2705178 RepID=UPI00402B40B0
MVACVYRWFNVNNSTLSMLHHLPRSFPQHHPILRYALDTYYGCLQSSYICGYKDSTLSMLHHLPRSFPQHHPILRYALDTYYGCLQSSYICGYKAGTWCSADREP